MSSEKHGRINFGIDSSKRDMYSYLCIENMKLDNKLKEAQIKAETWRASSYKNQCGGIA